jgi:hypothetical protein
MCFRALALLLIFCGLTATPVQASEIESIVNKTLDAYGGIEALSEVAAVKQTGQVYAKIRHAGQAGELLRIFEGSERLRVEIAYPDGDKEVRIVNGTLGWRNGQPAQGPSLIAMQTQCYRLALPLLLKQHSSELIDLGLVQEGGKALHALDLPLPEGVLLSVKIDPETGRILRSRAGFTMGSMILEFGTEYEDFRKVGKLLFAFREKNYASGQYTADTVLTSIELVEKQPAGRFEQGE